MRELQITDPRRRAGWFPELVIPHGSAGPDRSRGEASIRVLMYHGVTDDVGLSRSLWTFLHADVLRRHVDFLDRWGFTPITFRDVALHRRGVLNLPAKPVILTFDDGYLETHRVAVPILRDAGIRAVFFVLGDETVRHNRWDARKGFPELALMRHRDILDLHRLGFEIGSHTQTHPDLRSLDDDDAWREILHSRMNLEHLLGSPVQSFAYPYGGVNRAVKTMARTAGYDFACAVSTGPAVFSADDHEIRRVTIDRGVDLAAFALRMLAPWNRYTWLQWILARSMQCVRRPPDVLRRPSPFNVPQQRSAGRSSSPGRMP